MLWLDGMRQSEVDPADPTWLPFDYVRRIADVLDLAAAPGEPLRVVHVGGAAMALPRYVAHTRPRSRQIVLEPDGAMVEEVRRRLPLPPRSGIRVRVADGASGMRGVRDDGAEVVVLDAFAEGRVPPELVSVGFLADVARVLAPGGLFVANLSDTAPFLLVRSAVAGVRRVLAEALDGRGCQGGHGGQRGGDGRDGGAGEISIGAEPATLKARRGGNLVLVAGARVSADALAARARAGGAPYRLVTGRAVLDAFGGGRPIP